MTLTQHDSGAFLKINPGLQTIVLPPGYSGPKQGRRRSSSTIPRRVIIVGSFTWIAKRDESRAFFSSPRKLFCSMRSDFMSWATCLKIFKRAWVPSSSLAVFRGFVDDSES